MNRETGRSIAFVLALLMMGCSRTQSDSSTADTTAQRRLPPIPANVPAEIRASLDGLGSLESPQRAHAAARIGNLGEKATPAVPHLLAALGDENRQVRRRAAEALGNIRDLQAVEPLIAILGDTNEDWGVRCSAAVSLGKLHDSRAIKPLIGVLADMVSHVRLTAVIALGDMDDPAAEQAVAGTAQYDSDTRVRQAAEEALRRIHRGKGPDPDPAAGNQKD